MLSPIGGLSWLLHSVLVERFLPARLAQDVRQLMSRRRVAIALCFQVAVTVAVDDHVISHRWEPVHILDAAGVHLRHDDLEDTFVEVSFRELGIHFGRERDRAFEVLVHW